MSLKLDKRILLVLAVLLMLVIIPTSFAAEVDDAGVVGIDDDSMVDVSSAIDDVNIATSVDSSDSQDVSDISNDINISQKEKTVQTSNQLNSGEDYITTVSPSTITNYTVGDSRNVVVSVTIDDWCKSEIEDYLDTVYVYIDNDFDGRIPINGVSTTSAFNYDLNNLTSEQLPVGSHTLQFGVNYDSLETWGYTTSLGTLSLTVVDGSGSGGGDEPIEEPDDGSIWVSANGTSSGNGTRANPYNSISTAISRAYSGDTIKILAGDYTLYQQSIGKSLNIIGVGEVNIRGSSSGAWLLTQTGTYTVNYTGLTFRDTYTGTNGMFYLRSNTNCFSNFIDCNFINMSGSCLMTVSQNVNMTRCNFINNSLTGSGSSGGSAQGILFNYYGTSKKLTINYCNFLGNNIAGNIVHDYSNSPTVNLDYNFWETTTKPTSNVFNNNQNVINYFTTVTATTEDAEITEGDTTNLVVKFVDGATQADLTASMATVDLEVEPTLGSIESYITVKDNVGTSEYTATAAGDETIAIGYGDKTYATVTLTVEEVAEGTIFVDATAGSDTTGTGAKDSPYATIEKALEDLSTEYYIISVKSGNYTLNNAAINDDVTIKGKGDVTVSTTTSFMTIGEDVNVELDNIKFTGATSTGITSEGTLTMTDCVFTGNGGTNVISGGEVNAMYCEFYGNTITGDIIDANDGDVSYSFWGTSEEPSLTGVTYENWIILSIEMSDSIYQGGSYPVKAIFTENDGTALDETLKPIDVSFANTNSDIASITESATVEENEGTATYTATGTGEDTITLSIGSTELDSKEFTVLANDKTKTYVDAERGDDVNGDGSSAKPYKTIQTAYTKDTLGVIAVNDGVYELGSSVTLSKAMKIVANGDNVILKGTGSTNAFSPSPSQNIQLIGLTFTNFGGSYVVSGSSGTSGGSLKVINCTFVNNNNTYGVIRTYVTSEILGCTIVNNTATSHSSGAFAGLVEFASGSGSVFNYNILVGNKMNNANHLLLDSVSGTTANAEYNYWGSNEGVDSSKISSTASHPNWLVLNSELSDESAIVGGDITVSVKFEANDGSELDDTVSNKHITFDASLGTVSPETTSIVDNEITATYTGVSEGMETLIVNIEGVELTSFEFEVEEVPEGTIFVDAAKGSDTTGTGEITNPYASIKYAINKRGDNTQIIVKAGNYSDTSPAITIKNSPLTITGKGDVYYKYNATTPIFMISSAAVSPLTINNIKFVNTKCGTNLIYSTAAVDVNIDNCVFEDINATQALINTKGNIKVENSIISNVTAANLFVAPNGTLNNNFWGSNDKPTVSDNFTLDNWVVIQTEMPGINENNEVSAETYYDINAKFMSTADGETFADLTSSMPEYTLTATASNGTVNDIIIKDNAGSTKYICDVQDVEDEVVLSTKDAVIDTYAFNVTEREWGRIYVDIVNGDNTTGNGSKANPFKTIDKALILNNQTGGNQEIIVNEGTYTGYYILSNNVTITGRGNVILDCDGYYFSGYTSSSSNNVVLNNLTIANQTRQSMFQYARSVTLNNCIVENATGGSGIVGSEVTNFIANNTVFRNMAYTGNSLPIASTNNEIYNSVFSNISFASASLIRNGTVNGNFWGGLNTSQILSSYYANQLSNWVIAIPSFEDETIVQGQTPTLTINLVLTDGENQTELTETLPDFTLGLSSELNSFDPETVTISNNVGTSTYTATNYGDEEINLYDADKVLYTISTFVEEAESDEKIFVDAVNGDDTTGDGSKDKPYKSLETALNALSETKNVIVLNNGNYDISDYTIDTDATIRWSKQYAEIKATNLTINADVTFENLVFKDGDAITVNADKDLTVINTTFVENDGAISSNGNLIIKESKFIGNNADDNGVVSALGGTVDIKLSEFIANNNGEKPIVYAASGVTGDVNDNYWGVNNDVPVSESIAPTSWVALIIDMDTNLNASETSPISFSFKNTTDGEAFTDLSAAMPTVDVTIDTEIGEIIPAEGVSIENNAGSAVYNATTEGAETITLSTEGVDFETIEFDVGASVEGMIFVSKEGSDETGDGSRLNPYASIKYALGKAVAGSKVIVNEGVYDELSSTSIYSDVEIIGVGDVTITGKGQTYTNPFYNLQYSNANVSFTNLKFVNITVDGGYSYEYPSVIYGPTSSSYYPHITITNCTFENNKGNCGPIKADYAYITITGSKFINNIGNASSTDKVMPVYLNRGGLNISNTIFVDNSRYRVDVYLYSYINYVDINDNFWGNNEMPVVNNVTNQTPTRWAIVTAEIDSDNITATETHTITISFNITDGETTTASEGIFQDLEVSLASVLNDIDATAIISGNTATVTYNAIKDGDETITVSLGDNTLAVLEFFVDEFDDGTKIFVDAENGDDANNGSKEAPLKTLEAALNAVTDTKKTISVQEGEYEISGTISKDVEIIGKKLVTVKAENLQISGDVSFENIVFSEGNEISVGFGNTLTIKDSEFNNNGGIVSMGNLNIEDTVFYDCYEGDNEGIIYAYYGSVNIARSAFVNCEYEDYILNAEDGVTGDVSNNYWGVNDNIPVSEAIAPDTWVKLSATVDLPVAMDKASTIKFEFVNNDDTALDFTMPDVEIDVAAEIGELQADSILMVDNNQEIGYISAVEGAEEISANDEVVLTFDVVEDETGKIYVATNGSDSTGTGSKANPYASISQAITKNNSLGGNQEIIVMEGTYDCTQQLTISKNVTITGRGEVILTKSSSGYFIYAYATSDSAVAQKIILNNLIVENMTGSQNGLIYYKGYYGYSYSTYSYTTTYSGLTINNCTFRNNKAPYGIVYGYQYANFSATGNVFYNNTATSGSILRASGNEFNLNYNVFIDNKFSNYLIYGPTGQNGDYNFWNNNTKPMYPDFYQITVNKWVVTDVIIDDSDVHVGETPNIVFTFKYTTDGETYLDLEEDMPSINLILGALIGEIAEDAVVEGNTATIPYTATTEGDETITFNYGDKEIATLEFTVGESLEGKIFVDAANGDDETGDGTIDSPYASIAKAIAENAAIGGGQTIVVKEGEYELEDVEIADDVIIRCDDGATISGNNALTIVDDAEVSIINAHFADCTKAIETGEDTTLHIINSTFENNNVALISNGTTTIYRTVIKGNNANPSFGKVVRAGNNAVIKVNSGSLDISYSAIMDNNGNVIDVEDGATVTANNNYWNTNDQTTIDGVTIDNWAKVVASVEGAGDDGAVFTETNYPVKINFVSNDDSELDDTIPDVEINLATTLGTIDEKVFISENEGIANFITYEEGSGEIKITAGETEINIPVTATENEEGRIYVDQATGDDENNAGTRDSPYATIGRALARNVELGGNQEIIVYAGTYVNDTSYYDITANVTITGRGEVILTKTHSNYLFRVYRVGYSEAVVANMNNLIFADCASDMSATVFYIYGPQSSSRGSELNVYNCTFINNTGGYLIQTYQYANINITKSNIINNVGSSY